MCQYIFLYWSLYDILTPMNTQNRREKILKKLSISTTANSASSLAKEFSVSRQIIVGDIAILRAEGHNIIATPKGYVMDEDVASFDYIGIIPCKHSHEQLKEELYTIVDFGATVIDVTIEHKIYGQISGQLNISSRFDADLFCNAISDDSNKPLSSISGGIHIHRIGCKNEEIFNHIKNELKNKGILL